MADDALCWTSASELAIAIRRQRVSPVEVVDAVLDRIERTKALNAYVTLDAEGARRAAKAAERAVAVKRATLGPLHGVPFSVKDLVVTRGMRTTFGTPLYRDHVPDEDAPSVERMKAAGAILLGKTNTPTFGWIGITDNLLFGVTRNPWGHDHTPGGVVRDLRPEALLWARSRGAPRRGLEPVPRRSDDAHGERRRPHADGVRRSRRARSVLAPGPAGRLRPGAPREAPGSAPGVQ